MWKSKMLGEIQTYKIEPECFSVSFVVYGIFEKKLVFGQKQSKSGYLKNFNY